MTIELKVPALGESINEVEIGAWLKTPGQAVRKDDPLVSLESEKATVELPAPASGRLERVLKEKGQTAQVGEVIGLLAEEVPAPGQEPQPVPPIIEPPKAESRRSAPKAAMPAAQRLMSEHGLRPENLTGSGPGGRILKEDVLRQIQPAVAPPRAQMPPLPPPAGAAAAGREAAVPEREEEVVPMSRLRRTVAERLVQAQHTAALLTTFNEIDMGEVSGLRQQYQELFQHKYNVKLGFMSFFVKAAIDALKQYPILNAQARGTSIIYHNYFDIGVAVGGGKGLVVPVLRNAERMSFAEVETTIAGFAQRARENRLTLEELQGGTFTISNGGVYGSLLSTPIINPPQSGVLGLHAIQERPVARAGAVVIRPMMYVALTYDHRLVDGREAVSCLKRIKETLETPARMLLEI